MTNIALNTGAGGSGLGGIQDANRPTSKSLSGLDALALQPSFTFSGSKDLISGADIPHDPYDPNNPGNMTQFQMPNYVDPKNVECNLLITDRGVPAPRFEDSDGDGKGDQIVITGQKIPKGYELDPYSRGIYMTRIGDKSKKLYFTPWYDAETLRIASALRQAGDNTATSLTTFLTLGGFLSKKPSPASAAAGTASTIAIVTTRPPSELPQYIYDQFFPPEPKVEKNEFQIYSFNNYIVIDVYYCTFFWNFK
jgi:hypothetical protein